LDRWAGNFGVRSLPTAGKSGEKSHSDNLFGAIRKRAALLTKSQGTRRASKIALPRRRSYYAVKWHGQKLASRGHALFTMRDTAMSPGFKSLLLCSILLVACFFRFHALTTIPPGLYLDEAMDGVNAQNVAQTGQFKVFYPEDTGREGLYVNILALAFKYHILPQTAPWSVRVPAAVAGVLTVLGVYFLVGELFNARDESAAIRFAPKEVVPLTHKSDSAILALISSFFLATSFWHINFSRIAFRAILAPCCLVWSVYLLLKMIRARKVLVSSLLAISAGIIYGLGFYTYISFRITPLLILLFIPFFRKTPRFWTVLSLFLMVTVLVALPIGWYYLHHPADFFGRMSQVSALNDASPFLTLSINTLETALMLVWRGDPNWRHNFSGAPELFWPIGMLFVLGIAIATKSVTESVIEKSAGPDGRKKADEVSKRRSSLFAPCFLLVWLVLGALPAILSNEERTQSMPHALRSLLMVVPAIVFAAMGALLLYDFLASKLDYRWMATIAICFVAFVIFETYSQYFVAWAENPDVHKSFSADSVTVGQQINALPASAEKYVVVYPLALRVYGIPITAEPVMYITHSFVPDPVAQKYVNRIHYLVPSEVDQIPPGTPADTIFKIQ
jgi:4-amino-4-deoxy-L-arabinose transferase-like glycosyltransferase